MKALVLLSGGLDSILATRLMLKQNIEVEALHFTTIFCQCTSAKGDCHSAASALSGLNVPVKVINNTADFLAVMKNPKHGYGSNMNPCIDCRINMFRSAKRYMQETGAAFIVTGEVLGQRPMSQHKRAMQIIEKESGLEGLVLRPLSAGLLEPSIPEKEGWVDRSKLLAIKGRSRKPQISMAELFEIKDYPCPAGGCLLTDPGFSARVKDLMAHHPAPAAQDFLLLKAGRHFRLDKNTKAVIGRDEQDNKIIELRKQPGDVLMEARECVGPITLLRGDASPDNIKLAAAITARYADVPDKEKEIELAVRHISAEKEAAEITRVIPLKPQETDRYLVRAD